MKRLAVIGVAISATVAQAALPAVVESGLEIMRSDFLACIGLVLAAGCAVGLAKRVYRDIMESLK